MRWHSQFGQDYWIATKIFPGVRDGTFIDVGASHRVDGTMSNTLALERDLGWRGLLIEGNRTLAAELWAQRRSPVVEAVIGDCDGRPVPWLELEPERVDTPGHGGILRDDDERLRRFRKSQASVELRTTLSLQTVLSRHSVPEYVHFLSIDVEGAECEVLDGLDFSLHRFGAVVVESLPDTEPRVTRVLEGAGYVGLGRVHGDLYFLPRDGVPQDRDPSPQVAAAEYAQLPAPPL